MNRSILYIFLFLMLSLQCQAQLTPLINQHQVNGLAINPAYTGSQNALSVELFSRAQWIGFEGSPRTLTFSMHSPLRNRKVNLGLIVLSDRFGAYVENGILLNYAYRMKLGKGNFSLGLAGGLSGRGSDLNALRTIQSGDPLVQDPGARVFLPEFSAGAYYYCDRFYLGLSMPLFLSHPKIEGNGKYGIALRPGEVNYMLSGGYIFRLTNDVELMPSALIRSAPSVTTQLDMNLSIIFREQVWLGAGYRSNRNLSGLIQIQITTQLRIGYCYAYEFSALEKYQSGSHEVLLSYRFRYLLEAKGPRYF